MQLQPWIIQTSWNGRASRSHGRSNSSDDHGLSRRAANDESADADLVSALGQDASGNIEKLNVRRGRCRNRGNRIEGSEEPAACRLSHNRGFIEAALVIGRDTSLRKNATIGISRDAAAFAIDTDIVEVEKISVVAANHTAQADGTFLDRIARGGVDGDPVRAAVVSRRDIKIPDALVGRLVLKIATRGAAEKTERRPIAIARDNGWKDGALDPARSVMIRRIASDRHTDFVVIRPRLAVIGGDGDMRTSVAVNVAKVNRVVGANTYGRIARADAIRH